MKTGPTIIHPVHAKEGEYVDIHWRLRIGKTLTERRTCVPTVVQAARTIVRCPIAYPMKGQCALAEGHEGAHVTAAGLHFTIAERHVLTPTQA